MPLCNGSDMEIALVLAQLGGDFLIRLGFDGLAINVGIDEIARRSSVSTVVDFRVHHRGHREAQGFCNRL